MKKTSGKKCFTLSAVSVCISYSEYLEQCLCNRKQFDRWAIVTVPDDKATSKLCAQSGLECCIAQDLSAGGLGFHAAHNKSRFINAGLRYLRRRLRREQAQNVTSGSWIIVIDADVMLPGDFRDRLEALLPLLDPRKLYGMWGRRVVRTSDEFFRLKSLNPWETYLERSPPVIGYFNLFHMQGPQHFYPASPRETGGHDDYRFYRKFGPKSSVKLPMTVLHLGSTAVHWEGRVENVGASVAIEPKDKVVLAQVVEELGMEARTQDAVLLGAWWSAPVHILAPMFRRVLVVDLRDLAEPGHDALQEADRAFLWRRFTEGLAGLSNVFLVRGEGIGGQRAGLPVTRRRRRGAWGWCWRGWSRLTVFC